MTTPDDVKYAILSETDCELCETYYFFLRYDGNEKHLKLLYKDIDLAQGTEIYDDVHVFDMDIDNLVCEITAKQMCRVALNSESYHRKFNGELNLINFDFTDKDDDDSRSTKLHNKLAFGSIEDFIDDEDIDEDLVYIGVDGSDTDSSSDEEELKSITKRIPASLKIRK